MVRTVAVLYPSTGLSHMIDTVVVATDGSDSVRRCVITAIDLADRFDAELHALYVGEDPGDALSSVAERTDRPVTTAVREGAPADEITAYAVEHDIDLVATGTRGRHGEHRFLLGSVAEKLIRECPVPVLSVRQLAEEAA